MSIQSLDPTYCSKIVWQAYAKTGDAVGHATFTIKAPYGFLKKKNYKTVTPKVIVSEGRKILGKLLIVSPSLFMKTGDFLSLYSLQKRYINISLKRIFMHLSMYGNTDSFTNL